VQSKPSLWHHGMKSSSLLLPTPPNLHTNHSVKEMKTNKKLMLMHRYRFAPNGNMGFTLRLMIQLLTNSWAIKLTYCFHAQNTCYCYWKCSI